MQSSKCYAKNDKTSVIPVKKNLSTMIKINSPKSEYSIKQNLFDPSKSSPPNNFLKKLEKRMKIYNSNIFYVDNMDISLDNE